MEQYLTQLYSYLSAGQNQVVFMTVFICFMAAAVILRMVTCSAYRTAHLTLRVNSKDIRTRDEIAKIRYTMLRNLAADYIRVSDKSVSRIPTAALVDRQLANMTLIGWRFINIMNFVEALEGGLLWVGLILAVVFNDNVFLYGTLAAGSFVLFRLFAAFFDFRSVYNVLSNDLLIYLEREIGQFFAADSGGAIMRFKTELTDVISRQTVGLQESINKLGNALSSAVDKKLAAVNVSLKNSMDEWEQAIKASSSVQNDINSASEKLHSVINEFSNVSAGLAEEMKGNNESVSGRLAALTEATTAFAAEQEAFLAQAKFIERNQHILENTYQSYEAALQNLTQTIGDGLGAYLKMHAQTASQTVNDALSANIEIMNQLMRPGGSKND